MSSPAHSIRNNLYPACSESLPATGLDSGAYSLRFAHSATELKPVFRLRYKVFNEELEEGLAESSINKMDRDIFDAQCNHLYIVERATGDVIGTYRLQTRQIAEDYAGFYSSSLFDLASIPESVLEQSVELGRACIHKNHRSIKVLYLLWKGIGLYMSHNDKRYLFGCCSLTSQSPGEGMAVYTYLRQQGQLSDSCHVFPQTGFSCEMEPFDASRVYNAKVPRLMRAYLSFGAKICGPPAIDTQFKTIDYLALFDILTLSNSVLAFYQDR